MLAHRHRCRMLPDGVIDVIARGENPQRTAGFAGMPVLASGGTEGLCQTYRFYKKDDVSYAKKEKVSPNDVKGYLLARSFIAASLEVEIPIESRLERDVPDKKLTVPSGKLATSAHGESVTGYLSHPTATRKYFERKPLMIEYHASGCPSLANCCIASLLLSRNQCDNILPMKEGFAVLEHGQEKARMVEDVL